MATKYYYIGSASAGSGRMHSIYRMSDAQPDWVETDPSQPDYIKNKELVERFRPILVNSEEILDDSYQSGNLNLVSGENVTLEVQGNTVVISAKSGGGSSEDGDSALQEIEVDTGLKVSDKAENKQTISIDDEVIFILDANF